MAWWTSPTKNIFSKFKGGITKVPFVYSLIKQATTSKQEFYELEVAEVERIILDLQDFIDNDLVLSDSKTPDFSYLGAIKARLVYSQQDVKVEELAKQAGSINYEIITRINSRIKRINI